MYEVRDSLFKFIPAKNPVISLVETLSKNARHNLTREGELISYKIIKETACYASLESTQIEMKHAAQIVADNFLSAFHLARLDIESIVTDHYENFNSQVLAAYEEYSNQIREV